MPEISQARPRQRPSRLRNRGRVQHGVELLAHGGIDIGDVAVKRRPQRPPAARRPARASPNHACSALHGVETAVQERRQFGGLAACRSPKNWPART